MISGEGKVVSSAGQAAVPVALAESEPLLDGVCPLGCRLEERLRVNRQWLSRPRR